MYGPRERPEKLYHKLTRCILEDREFTLYEGSERHTRSYTFIEDVMQGFLNVLDRLDVCLGEIFNIGSDREITTGEGIRLVEEILGKQARKVVTPKRAGDQLRTHADIGKARRLLDYDPKTEPRDGLPAEVAWVRDEVLGG